MLLSSDPPHNSSPWKRFLLTATLLSLWAHPGSARVSIVTIPDQPVEGDNVRLTALNLPARVYNATWYTGLQAQYPDMITHCISTSQAGPCVQHVGPAHTSRETLTSWNTLEIGKITPSDSGFYSLVLNTDSGPQKVSTYVHVQRTHTEFVLKPDISANVTVALELKDSVVFTCHTVEDSLRVLWYNGGLLLQGGERLELSNNNRTLTIHSVKRYDQGTYFCRVWNESDYKTSDTIVLTVIYGPGSIVTLSYPQSPQGILESDLNYSVLLECVTSANPDPRYIWSLNGKVCGTGERHIIRRLAPKDLGNYTCTAQNSVGQLTSPPIQVQLPKDIEPVEPIEPEPVYSLSGVPAICLTVAGGAGLITFFGCMLYAGINKKALKNGRNSRCGCF
ncbi:carcinoembryonic antigen-related cell adhesion molecule 5-like [Sarcophilus harrisii]|uniref:Ig-like domain-containing protein n=1 Tax=Sarcophilus harrisii TaxID=9305 RepID=G3VBK6_SARHA|nr:carcinoembryonic antigen-related cell adhesion molecule 5-like [Sarcophilus harrisii]